MGRVHGVAGGWIDTNVIHVANIVDFGADSTGVTDSFSAIQAAIDLVESENGGTIYAPVGTFLVKSKLVIDSPNVILRGENGIDKISSGETYTTVLDFDLPASTAALQIKDKNTRLEDIALRAKSGGTSNVGILVDNESTGTTVFKVGFNNVAVADFASHGIRVVEGELVVINDSIVRDCTGRGISIEGANGVGINCTIRNTRVAGSGASESVHINNMINTVFENLQVLDGAASSVLINLVGCLEMLILNADVERPNTATGIKIAKGADVTIIGGFGNTLSKFIDVTGDSNNKMKGLTIIGPRAASGVSTGLTIDANVTQVNLGPMNMNATTPFAITGGYDEEATGTFTLSPRGTTDINSNAGAVTGTLGDGHIPGDIKTIIMTEASNSSTVSVTNHETSDPEIITFAAIDDTAVLMWTGTEWITLTLSGATV